jgi:ribosomal protein S18 acetylase RimI-like enzyme
MLFDAMKEWAMEKGLTEIRLQVYDKNIPAVKAYEKYGFSKNLVEMRMSLNE